VSSGGNDKFSQGGNIATLSKSNYRATLRGPAAGLCPEENEYSEETVDSG